MWDAQTGELLATVKVPGLAAEVEFLPDEPTVVITNGEGRTFVFRCEVCASYEELIGLAECRVTRDLTAEERERFGLEALAG